MTSDRLSSAVHRAHHVRGNPRLWKGYADHASYFAALRLISPIVQTEKSIVEGARFTCIILAPSVRVAAAMNGLM